MRRFISSSSSALPALSMSIKPSSSYEALYVAKSSYVSRKTKALAIKVAALLILLVLAFLAMRVILAPTDRVYGLMIDAGSTGSRLHAFVFTRDDSKKLTLVTEDFLPVKPGISSYKDDPSKAAESLEPLLQRAKTLVPALQRGQTPIFLRATAGLRLVGDAVANEILGHVRTKLKSSGFRFDDSSWAGILGGSDEGVYSWITVNYLMDRSAESTVGTLEMGGGSAQIAFVPTDNSHSAPGNCSTPAELTMFKGAKMPLYTFSNLKFGLKMGRSMALNAFKRTGILKSNPCINAGSEQGVKIPIPFDENQSTVTIHGDGNFGACRRLIEKVVVEPNLDRCSCQACTYHGVAAPTPISEYVAIAFYLDRTLAVGMTTPLTVADIRRKGEEVCAMHVDELWKKYPVVPNGEATDVCLDLAFITTHLEYAHGITEASRTKLHMVDKIKGVELGWALGAMFAEMNRLNIGY